jgi:hypothetical protein
MVDTRRIIRLTQVDESRPLSTSAQAVIAIFNAAKGFAAEDKKMNSAMAVDVLRKNKIDVEQGKRVLSYMVRAKNPLLRGDRTVGDNNNVNWTNLEPARHSLPEFFDYSVMKEKSRKEPNSPKGKQSTSTDADKNQAHDLQMIFAHFEANPKRTFANVSELNKELDGKVFNKQLSMYIPYLVLSDFAPLTATRNGFKGQWKNLRQIRTELAPKLTIDWDKLVAEQHPAVVGEPQGATKAVKEVKPAETPVKKVKPTPAPVTISNMVVTNVVAGGNLDVATLVVQRLLTVQEMNEFLINLIVGISNDQFVQVWQTAMERRVNK